MAPPISLRDVQAGDLPIFFEHQADPEASRMANFPSRDRESFFTHWAKIMADPAIEKQTILFEGRVAGNIVCFEMQGKREVGYWLGREYWGQGIATRALRLFLKKVTIRPLYAVVARQNTGSIRVLQKCGFEILSQAAPVSSPDDPSAAEILLRLAGEPEEHSP